METRDCTLRQGIVRGEKECCEETRDRALRQGIVRGEINVAWRRGIVLGDKEL